MINKKRYVVLCAAALVIITISAPVSCKSSPTTTTPQPAPTNTTPGGPIRGTVINSDCIVTAQIKASRKQSTGYPWEADILIQTSVDVGNLPNPTKNSIGKVVTVKTDTDMNLFKIGDVVTAKIKNTGDVNIPGGGISLYMYNVTSQIPPQY